MKLQVKSKQKEIDIEDYYSIRIGALWRGVKHEHISFWALCVYFFFEYVRPQSIYPVISIIPWAQITFLAALAGVLTDKSARWVSNIENKLMIIFFIIIVLSGLFAFNPRASWQSKDLFLNWFLLYFLVINIIIQKEECSFSFCCTCFLDLKCHNMDSLRGQKEVFLLLDGAWWGRPAGFVIRVNLRSKCLFLLRFLRHLLLH